MTLAEARRVIRAAIQAARKEGVAVVEVVEGGTTLRIPLVPDDKAIAEAVTTDDNDDWSN
jgi:hypothetical protein